mgnify:CR=1 FL=1
MIYYLSDVKDIQLVIYSKKKNNSIIYGMLKEATTKTVKIAGLRLESQCQQIKGTLFEKTTFCN